jgi:hypothetical protein
MRFRFLAVYSLNYTPTLWGYTVGERLYLEVRGQKRLNTIKADHVQDGTVSRGRGGGL